VIIEGDYGSTPVNVIRTGTGNYKFDAAFSSGGLYYIKVSSTSPSFGNAQLANGAGQPVNVFKKGDECVGDECTNPPPNYIIFVVGGVVVAGMIILLAQLASGKKRRK
jgi:hypothetical protein